MIRTLILSILFSTSLNAKLIDKVAGVINDKVFALSEITRISKTIPIRKEIAPFIYNKETYSTQDILRTEQNSFIVRDKLEEVGFVVSDSSVEDRIKQTEKSLGLGKGQLIEFLKSRGITYNEYFEILRSAMEYNIFNRRIIAPLVTITDQEMKNHYYKNSKGVKTSSFKYNIIDFNIPIKKVLKRDRSKFRDILIRYRKTGSLPQIYSDLSTDDLGEINGEDVSKKLNTLWAQTDEDTFSKIYIDSGLLHVYFVDSKEIADSADFLKNKRQIYNTIFLERSSKLSQSWFSRESLNYYLLSNL